MRSLRRNVATGLLVLASRASAQVASYCPATDVCYKLNIPDSTASSGNGDIFFQLSAPSTYEWVALGQGSSMSGSNIFVVYTAGNGNVTISPRLGKGEREPNFNADAKVTLLEGSGVFEGKMIANIKCSSCNSWSGGSASFSDGQGSWIWAASTSGGPKDTTDQSAGINQHREQGAFQWSYANAKGGNSVNPLINASSGSGTGTGTRSCVPRPASTGGSSTTGSSGSSPTINAATPTQTDDDDRHRGRPTNFPSQSWGYPYPTGEPSEHDKRWEWEKRDDVVYCDEGDSSGANSNSGVTVIGGQSRNQKMLVAHGAIATVTFAILFPFGAIGIRLASFTGLVWVHAAFQGFAYLMYIVAFGLGVYIANQKNELDQYHPIIGIVVFALLFFQPILGFLHHAMFKKYQSRTFWSYAHLWLGRLVITLGIINGGLGFKLADDPKNRSAMIAYSVIAGVVWLAWVAATVVGERKRKRSMAHAAANAPPKYSESNGSPRETMERPDVPHPENGHYAPEKAQRTV